MVAVASGQVESQQIPMFDLRAALAVADSSIQRHLAEMHQRGQYILGPQTEAFESEFAAAMGGVSAVGVGSGTAALELCLRDAGVLGAGCEVVVPAMTSLFTAQAVLAVGARLRVADVAPENLLLTAESVERAITTDTRAVIAVHLYGQPCNLVDLAALCQSRGLVLIQDACQAHGTFHQGRSLSQFSRYCAYSFYPTKNLGALGDGGAVVTSDPDVAARIRSLRDGGRLGDQVARHPAINSRLDEMQACYLRAFLPHLDRWNEHRRHLASQYAEQLENSSALRLLPWDADSVHHLCVARSSRRDELRRFLLQRNIQTGIHYPVPIHEQPGFRPFSTWRDLPVHAANAAREIFSLPIGPHLSKEDVSHIVGQLAEFEQQPQ